MNPVDRERKGDPILFPARPAGILQGKQIAFQVEMIRKTFRPAWLAWSDRPVRPAFFFSGSREIPDFHVQEGSVVR